MSTYAVSDLHGHYEVFTRGLKEINFTSKDYLYVIGDAIDRGLNGIKILQTLAAMQNAELLIGNHEFMMLNSVDPEGEARNTGDDTELWLFYNGGMSTSREYCTLSRDERKELLSWLLDRRLIRPVMVTKDTGEKQDYILTHSYYIPGLDNVSYGAMSHDRAWDIVWRSLFREDTPCRDVYADFPEKTFITGHVPVQVVTDAKDPSPEPHIYNNLINIDGGLSYGNMMKNNAAIFYRLEDGKHWAIPLHN